MTTGKDRYEPTFIVTTDPTLLDGDFNSIQPALASLPPEGGKIFVKPGTYLISSPIQISASNIHIQGAGMGITNIVYQTALISTPALEVSNPQFGQPVSLTADTVRGETTLRVTPAGAATLASGDWILLYSNKSVDTEVPAKHAGELKQITAIDPVLGVITVEDQIYDVYGLADSAAILRVPMVRNITLADFSVTTTALSSQQRNGLLHFRFVENLQIERVESHHAYHSGMQLQSVLNSRVADCYIHHIRDIIQTGPQPPNARYGIVVGSASQNISISGCRFSQTRHAITTGGSSGQYENGVQRSITVSNCTSMLTDTAHFDTHQPAENVTYIGCAAIGGVPAPGQTEAVGFQMRGRNSSIIGCSVLQVIGKGIMIFGPVASGATISGNMIATVKAGAGTPGVGIFLDSAGASGHAITGNVIKQCEGSGIVGAGGNHDVLVSGNLINQTNSVVAGASILFRDAQRTLITGNKILNNATGKPIEMVGTSEGWLISHNSFSNNHENHPLLVGVSSLVVNNPGYNPIGTITNPWPISGGDLTNNVAGGTAFPESGMVYTVRQSPKTILVASGLVNQITINGTPTGMKAGVFKLGIGETISVSYAGGPPITHISGD